MTAHAPRLILGATLLALLTPGASAGDPEKTAFKFIKSSNKFFVVEWNKNLKQAKQQTTSTFGDFFNSGNPFEFGDSPDTDGVITDSDVELNELLTSYYSKVVQTTKTHVEPVYTTAAAMTTDTPFDDGTVPSFQNTGCSSIEAFSFKVQDEFESSFEFLEKQLKKKAKKLDKKFDIQINVRLRAPNVPHNQANNAGQQPGQVGVVTPKIVGLIARIHAAPGSLGVLCIRGQAELVNGDTVDVRLIGPGGMILQFEDVPVDPLTGLWKVQALGLPAFTYTIEVTQDGFTYTDVFTVGRR